MSANQSANCSVIFVDVVGYAKLSVSAQVNYRQRFTTMLSDALGTVASAERIVLDTGDGAAITFVSSPTDALRTAIRLREAARIETELNRFAIRVGVNLGPVKLVRDDSGAPNVIGDGISVAQRIMGFASPGQVIVSRAFYDAVAPNYSSHFKYEGSRTDQHVREHEIYVVGEASSIDPQTPAAALRGSERQNEWEPGSTEPIGEQRKRLLVVGAFLSLLVFALGLAVLRRAPAPMKGITPPPIAAAPAAPVSAAPTAATSVEASSAEVSPRTSTESPASDAPKSAPPPAAAPSAPAARYATADLAVSAHLQASNPATVPLASGTVLFAIQPWGEVFINGRSVGVSPPLKQSRLAPGRYKIEVKNTTLAAYAVSIEVKSKEETVVKHKFQ